MNNKLEFNNLVVTNKKKIQQVKTKTIQKLVQKIKKLKYLLDKNPENDKNKERFRKATLCLEELKKLKCIALMKRVLMLEKSPSAILTNGLSLPDEVAVAMVTVNKFMEELVKVFREKLGISNDNKNWKKELMQASKKEIKAIKTEKKRKSRQILKEQKALSRKRTEWLKNRNSTQNVENINEQNNKMVIEKNDEGANVSTLGYWKIEEIDDKPPVKREIGKVKVKESKEQPINKKRKNSQENIIDIFDNEDQQSPKSEEIKNHSKKIHAEESPECLNTPFVINYGDNNDLEKTDIEENVTHVIDPFFITDSGENYRSSAVVVRNGKVVDPQISQKTLDIGSFEHKQRKSTDIYRNHPKNNNYGVSNAKERISHKSFRETVKENKTEGLHPSWAAKQKHKTVIGSFQGKKIKFEDDNNQVEDIYDNSKAIKSDSQYKTHLSANIRKNDHKAKDLHPSWAAKQKLNATITDFKGKKITFGDEEVLQSSSVHINAPLELESLNTTKGLHPSWLAKQKQKPTITTFQGKKTTFQDDE